VYDLANCKHCGASASLYGEMASRSIYEHGHLSRIEVIEQQAYYARCNRGLVSTAKYPTGEEACDKWNAMQS
jgi:hypothetical protein